MHVFLRLRPPDDFIYCAPYATLYKQPSILLIAIYNLVISRTLISAIRPFLLTCSSLFES